MAYKDEAHVFIKDVNVGGLNIPYKIYYDKYQHHFIAINVDDESVAVRDNEEQLMESLERISKVKAKRVPVIYNRSSKGTITSVQATTSRFGLRYFEPWVSWTDYRGELRRQKTYFGTVSRHETPFNEVNPHNEALLQQIKGLQKTISTIREEISVLEGQFTDPIDEKRYAELAGISHLFKEDEE